MDHCLRGETLQDRGVRYVRACGSTGVHVCLQRNVPAMLCLCAVLVCCVWERNISSHLAAPVDPRGTLFTPGQIGRASCRERV